MKYIEKLLDKLKTLHIKIRLQRVLKAIEIKKLYPWQENYILHKSTYVPCGRATGKTTAIIIETLLWHKEPVYYQDMRSGKPIYRWGVRCDNPIAHIDPDYFKNPHFHDRELLRCWTKCSDNSISIFPCVRSQLSMKIQEAAGS